jgi:hypothetical protein
MKGGGKMITTEVANQSQGWGKTKQGPGQANDNCRYSNGNYSRKMRMEE